jgi:predicted site-specific integrase-resolvase
VIKLPKRLLQIRYLQPGESLKSLLIRLARANDYRPLRDLETAIRFEYLYPIGKLENVANPHFPETYAVLTALTQIDPIDLYCANIHSFSNVFTPPTFDATVIELPGGQPVPIMDGKFLGKLVIPSQLTRYCSYCLREKAYHQLAWLCRCVCVCLKHQCLLLGGCPNCNQPVDIESLMRRRCGQCKADLCQAHSVSLIDDSFGLNVQQVTQSWLGLCPSVQRDDLPFAPSNVLYRFLENIRTCIISRLDQLPAGYLYQPFVSLPANASLKSRVLLPAQDYVLYTTAFKTLCDWPNGFHGFMSAYCLGSQPLVNRTSFTALGSFYTWLNREWSHPYYDFVQFAIDDCLAKGVIVMPSAVKSRRYQADRSLLLDRWIYVTMKDAAHELGVSYTTLDRLISMGYLDAVEQGNAADRYRLLPRSEVNALCQKWNTGLSLGEVATSLGISEEIVVDLHEIGLLEAWRGPFVDDSAKWLFNPKTVAGMQSDIGNRATALVNGTGCLVDMVGLTKASQMLTAIGLSAAGIINLVLQGKIQAYYLAVPTFALRNLYFEPGSLRTLIANVRDENRWITRTEVAKRLHVKDQTLSRWVQSGLLTPIAIHASAEYFDVRAVDAFANDYISSVEVMRILGVVESTVMQWTYRGRLRPISGPGIDGARTYLFRRIEIERLSPGGRLTAPQMAKKLGISRSQFSEWIRQGRVKPVSGPSIDGSKHYLFLSDVEDKPESETLGGSLSGTAL